MLPPQTAAPLPSHPMKGIPVNGVNGGYNKNTTKTEASVNPRFWFDGIGIPVFAVDLAGSIQSWNPRLAEITGTSAREVLRRSLTALIEPDSVYSWEKALRDSFEGKENCSCEVNLCCVNHSVSRFHIKITSQRDRSDEVVGAVCFVERLPEPPSRQRTLQRYGVESFSNVLCACKCEGRAPRSKRDFRLFFNQILVPVFIMDRNELICGWNKKITELTGHSQAEMLGKNFLNSLLSEESRLKAGQSSLMSLSCAQSSVVLDITCKDGRTCPCLVAPLIQQDDQDEASCVCVVVQDITPLLEQRQASPSKMAQFFETAKTPIFGLNVKGGIDMWNPKTAEVLGITEKLSLGQKFVDVFVQPALKQSVQTVLGDAFAGKGLANYELELKTRRGEIRHLLANFTPRMGQGGEVDGVVVFSQDVTEAAQHDRGVATMARELQQLLDTTNALIFGVDSAGRVKEWKGKTAEITGYTRDEALNKPFVNTFIASEFRGAMHGIIDDALKGKGTTNVEVEVNTKSGAIRYLFVDMATRRDSENKIVGAIAMAQDVTEASSHDRSVSAAASELRELIDEANAPIFGIDCNGDVNEWTDKTSEITGYTKDEALHRSFVETFTVPEMQDSVQAVLDSALQGRTTLNFEFEFRTKSSEIRPLPVNMISRHDSGNGVVGLLGVAQDVTEAVQRDRVVAAMALELRQLIDTANAPIFGIDVNGNVNEWNRRTQIITGYSKKETFGEPLVERFIAPSKRQKVQELLDAALQGNETSEYELEFVSKSGESRFLIVNATTRRDPEFNVIGVICVAQDVTEDRKHAEELQKMSTLRETQAAKVETERNMTAYFAHELRNPLGAIDSALSAMPDDMPESAKTLLTGMRLCCEFMSSIMNNLLDVRKMEEGKMTLKKVAISLKNLLNGVYKMLLPSVRPGVSFLHFCNTGPRGDWVLGDPHRIQQIMTNVVTNAIKYTVSGSVTVSIGWQGDRVVFECVDTGPGIPKNEQEKLFQRFSKRGGAPGTGLGLAIAKHLVELTGGSIRFESDPSVRPGTTCVVDMPLPLCDPPETKNEEKLAPFEEPLRFLIIDDVKMNRMMLKRRIKKSIAPNCSITEACTGEEALEIVGNQEFDVIIVDQYMEEAGGVMVGTDVIYAMRRMRVESIMIGCSGNDIDSEFLEAGADWVWQKPMPPNAKIIAHLRDAFSERKR